MTPLLKALLALAVLLPVGGFVAGTLVAADTDPTPRETIVISRTGDRGSSTVTGTATGTVGGDEPRPGTRFTAEPLPPTPPPPAPDRDGDDDDDHNPEPVVPQPVDVDDDDEHDDEHDDDDDDDDDDD